MVKWSVIICWSVGPIWPIFLILLSSASPRFSGSKGFFLLLLDWLATLVPIEVIRDSKVVRAFPTMHFNIPIPVLDLNQAFLVPAIVES